jgi:hypothetical protein
LPYSILAVVEIKIHNTMLKPVAVYGSEAWPVTEMDVKRLNTCEKKLLRRIYGWNGGRAGNVESKN